MQILRGFDDAAAVRGGHLSIGNFDGVHRGHQAMLRRLVTGARQAGVPAVALTFEPHPLNLVAPDRTPPRLTTALRRAELIAACGVDFLIEYPTDPALLKLTAREFFEQIICATIDARGIVEGPNFCFGRGRGGTIDVLKTLCDEARIPLTVMDVVSVGETLVSSSEIRQAIAAGRLTEAVAMLGNLFRVTGTVIRGAGRGASIGFGTANLGQIETLLPGDGVYAGVADFDGRRFAAAVNCGGNPTFGDTARKVEAHLIGYAGGDLYGRQLSVDLAGRVRDTLRFANVDALRRQLADDVRSVMAMTQTCLTDKSPT